jgi:hypothetical protein
MRARAHEAADWALLGAACGLLLVARLRRAALPTRRILAELRQRSENGARRELSFCERREVERFAWALAAAANHAPWRSDCLLRAMAAAAWLARRRLPVEFYLGARKTGGALTAHAWLRSGDVCVTGGESDAYVALIEPCRDALSPSEHRKAARSRQSGSNAIS